MGRPFGMARYNNILRAMLTVRIYIQRFTAGRPLGRPLQLRLVAAYFFIACMRFRRGRPAKASRVNPRHAKIYDERLMVVIQS